MSDLQKFRADVQRCLKHERARPEGYGGLRASRAVADLFVSYCTQVGNVGTGAAEYWLKTYVEESGTPDAEPTAEHIDWLGDALDFFDGTLAADRDFTDKDWEELRLLVDCEAETLPLDTLSSLMATLLERGAL